MKLRGVGSRGPLPWTARDIFHLRPSDWLTYHGTIALRRWTRTWRAPIPTDGDLETMTRHDLVYWLYKAQYPVERAVEGSGLEGFFAQQAEQTWRLPDGFVPANEIRLCAAGDLMDHAYLGRSAGFLYDAVADELFGADVSMANLECVLDPNGSASFAIRPPEPPGLRYGSEQFDAVKGHGGRGYAFLAAANNHSLDCGAAGVESTIRTLRDAGIAFHGVNESERDAVDPAIVERNEIRLGVVSHTFGLNARKPPPDRPWLVNRTHVNRDVADVDFRMFERQLRACAERSVDFAIVQLHWGLEHEYYPRPAQLEVAHRLAELGFDLVIGHHPHLVQPVELYRTRRDPDRVVPIYYSLGNLVNPFSHPAFRVGGLARVRLAKGRCADGRVRTYVREATTSRVFQEIDERACRIRLVPR